MDINPNIRALNRFGLGARLGEAPSINYRSWLLSQVTRDAAQIPPTGDLPSTRELVGKMADFRRTEGNGPSARQAFRKGGRTLYHREARAALKQAMTTQAPFAERLVRFWSNHFAVSIKGEPLLLWLAGAYEREVIRPHVFGKFEDMVLASARHPGMLVYLDQRRSVGPDSRIGRRGRRGLNENYARELMELHTLGVDGGYSQRDVEQLALVLTGWTAGGLAVDSTEAAPFVFNERMHQPGRKRIMDLEVREEGEGEGRRAIAWLSRHPSTANFIATKLVRHFVSDRPHPDDVALIREVFLDTQGDLAEVSRALVDLDSAFYGPDRKMRTPQDFMIALARATGVTAMSRDAFVMLEQLRQSMWAPLSPAGYGDSLQDWADPDGLLKRAEFGLAMAKGKPRLKGVDDLVGLVDQLVESPGLESLKTMLRQQDSQADQLALFLASPNFQWR